MAGENPQWGYTRIGGALANLGHEMVEHGEPMLHDHGIAPAPERSQRTPWKTFLQAHWAGLTAADFFALEVLTFAGLKRYLVFFVIGLQTRRVHLAGIHPQPGGDWVKQMARAVTDSVDGFLRTARYLIHDRDPLYTHVVADILTSGGVQPIRLPPKSPNLNAYAERFVRSIKKECLNRVIPLGESHLRLLAQEYVEHYHRERNHQGLDNRFCSKRHGRDVRPPTCSGASASADSSISTIERPRDDRRVKRTLRAGLPGQGSLVVMQAYRQRDWIDFRPRQGVDVLRGPLFLVDVDARRHLSALRMRARWKD